MLLEAPAMIAATSLWIVTFAFCSLLIGTEGHEYVFQNGSDICENAVANLTGEIADIDGLLEKLLPE